MYWNFEYAVNSDPVAWGLTAIEELHIETAQLIRI
jgi:hypothetical protein